MDIKDILSIVYMCIGGLSIIVALITRFAKGKVKKVAEDIQEVLPDAWQLLDLIQEAETHTNYTGDEKRDYVLSRFLRNHAELNETSVADAIDILVDFSKRINYKEGEQ